MATEKIIMAGFGGQGVMSMGQLLTYAGMIENKQVSWLPSYGPEMRGGTANCSVIVSDTPVGSPIITEDATAAIVMNLPSLTKFEGNLKSGGNIIINSSLIEKKASRTDVNAYYVPANEIANEIGNNKVANMIMLGAYLELTKVVSIDTVVEALKKVFGPSKQDLVPLNKEALERGANSVR
ncbi:2-oxoacid:acceptor oxidoreductase family protein [Alkaliphilus peptidifermentans]|uniref:2-oxoglutarate ferredoxin oxidoreductase subunit gamma n=1 Tax=Alkaliphilus peptidifermentans DSM 18978 TaxID=1120976 RepID=A0A1G5KQN1_9FIRM|nr:2-oxoacid:acceptor oxidoreductase family protein [Alkaliphilus peptidifermentans]SCZ02906.1 2-oxoglutarate ferredoxin oxidoreductase subunit gamma [Alkaliphilus peptidifermentans DSM 18978]